MRTKKAHSIQMQENDLLAQALGKLPQTGHMQGFGKFIYAFMNFHCLRGPIRNERAR